MAWTMRRTIISGPVSFPFTAAMTRERTDLETVSVMEKAFLIWEQMCGVVNFLRLRRHINYISFV